MIEQALITFRHIRWMYIELTRGADKYNDDEDCSVVEGKTEVFIDDSCLEEKF
jgi:hypothetical protein